MKTAWVAVDWGTSHLRLWWMAASGAVLARCDDDRGMGRLTPDQFQPVLEELLADDLAAGPLVAICCGMAGSRQGWAEARYASVPCAPPGIGRATHLALGAVGLDVYILPGLSQASPPDVMRGEETQIAGFLAVRPEFDGVLCLPGTHCKWVHISAGEVVSFKTIMTGEMFGLLAGQSVLRHSISGQGMEEAAFGAAVSRALSRPEALVGDLFSLRAEALLAGLDGVIARSRLSGLLIGAELAAAKPYWLGREVVILGESGLAQAYRAALVAQGLVADCVDAEEMTLNGLRAAYAGVRR